MNLPAAIQFRPSCVVDANPAEQVQLLRPGPIYTHDECEPQPPFEDRQLLTGKQIVPLVVTFEIYPALQLQE